MRVNSVSCVNYPKPLKKVVKNEQLDDMSTEINFRGKFGKIVGGAVGTGAVVAASFVVAPAVICLAGAGLLAGMVGGDIAEDKINKNDKKSD